MEGRSPVAQDQPQLNVGAGRVIIRTCNYPEDYPVILALWGSVGPGVRIGRSDAPGEIEKKLGRDPDLFLLAEVDGKIVGSVLGGFDGRRGMVYHLAVVPQFRQLGVGSLLMEELEIRLRARGCIRAYLLVTRDNQQAIHFYEQRGWVCMDYLHTFGKDLT